MGQLKKLVAVASFAIHITLSTSQLRLMAVVSTLRAGTIARRNGARRSSALATRAIFAKPAVSSSKKAAKTNKKQAAPVGENVLAQSFEFKVPGALLQSKNDLVIPITLGFSKANELFVGRTAMIGFAAAVLGEVLTGKGALAQFDTEPLILAFTAFNIFAALAGSAGLTTGKFVPDEEELKPRKKGALQDASVSLATPGKFFGISGFGFSKENELFVGRMAQLGFAASLIGEAVTGKGPLAQFDMETGLSLSQTEPLLLFSIVLPATTAINPFATGKFVDE